MNMHDAATRLGNIIARLGGGVSTTDERELKALHDRMLGGTGGTPNPEPAKKATARKAAARTVKPFKAETVAKAKKKAGAK